MNKKELKRVQMLMDEKLYKQLRKYSFHKEQSIAETARRALISFLKENK